MGYAIIRAMRSRIMYVERKSGLVGDARIGRVTFSKSGATLRYGGLSFASLKGSGYKANYVCIETGEPYWISGPRRDGRDHLYGKAERFEIDEDVADEYWRTVRSLTPSTNERTHVKRADRRFVPLHRR